MTQFDSIWLCMTHCDSFLFLLTPFWPHLTTFNPASSNITHFNSMWTHLTPLDPVWPIWTHQTLFQYVLTQFQPVCPQLTPVDVARSKAGWTKTMLLSSAYIVSPGPTSRNSFFLSVFVQRLRSKPWTYKSKFILSFFLSVFSHSVSDFLGFRLVKALVSGSGSDIPLIQNIEPSNVRARLSHATLHFLAWLSSAKLKIFILCVSNWLLMS